MTRLLVTQRTPAPSWRRLEADTIADVDLWCAEGQHYATYSGWVGSDGAVRVTPAMLAEHCAEHTAVAA